MIITTQVTYDYYEKAKPLFDSIKKYWKGRFVLGCIDFIPEDNSIESFTVSRHQIKSYRESYPKNRSNFITMQNGEFAKYIHCLDDEIILCIDADTIMQREFTADELMNIGYLLESNDILSVSHSNPRLTLKQVIINLGLKMNAGELNLAYGKNWDNLYEFTTSFLIAKKKTFLELERDYLAYFDRLMLTTDHHAGNQWLLNYICKDYKTAVLQPAYQCASWYDKFNTETKEGLLYVNNELTIFNHTKFN